MSRTADLTRELRETRTALEDAKVQLDLAGQHAVTLDQLNDGRCRYHIDFAIASDARAILGERVQVIAAE